MLKNRLCYLLILFCTALFFVCFNGYYSAYVFALSLALPVLSLLISLPGMLTLKLAVFVPGQEEPARAQKSAPILLHVQAVTAWVVPAGRTRARLVITNTFTDESRWEQMEFSPSRLPQVMEHTLSSSTCGAVTCQLVKARAYDLLGLFCLPVKARPESLCKIIVQPNVFRPALGMNPQCSPYGGGERYSASKPGGDPTELFGLREYRLGDRLNRVDWKLSQKTGGLMVKESSLPVTDRVLLLVDLVASGPEADALMDTLATLSDFFIQQETGHVIGFCQEGAWRFLEVSIPEDVAPAIELVLCFASRSLLPAVRPDSPPAGISRTIYLCSGPDPAVVGLLEELYPAARRLLLHLLPLEGKSGLPLEAQEVRIRPGHVPEDLDGLLL